jgi:hypothetical protein
MLTAVAPAPAPLSMEGLSYVAQRAYVAARLFAIRQMCARSTWLRPPHDVGSTTDRTGSWR